MARPFRRQLTVDNQPDVSVGISISFDKPNVFTEIYATNALLKQKIVNYLFTKKGERYMNPEFGTNIHLYIFEPVSILNVLQEELQSDLISQFPDIENIKVEISSNEDQHIQSIYIEWINVITQQSDSVNINLDE